MPYYRCPACGSMSHSVAAYSTAGVCANCSAALPDTAKIDVLPESTFGLNRSMPAGISAPAQARRAVVTLPLAEHARDRLALLVSELVTNSIRHAGLAAGDPIELQVTSDSGQLWVAVRDQGPGFDPRNSTNGSANGSANGSTNGSRESGGFGLAIVEALADDWGVDRAPSSCTVWCALNANGVAA